MQAVLTLGGIAFDGGANITRNGHGWGLQAITDWHSLTASKAQINERPQAHGAFDPGTDWRKSTANEIKAAYWGHDHNDLIRAIQQLTALANRDELMECTMDVDGVVLRRMVSVRNVDVPDTRGRSNIDGVAVDVLAPDPRAYGPVSVNSTGLARHGGGIVFPVVSPVDFGTPGADGRTVFTNTGTAVTSVTMTVTGGGSRGIVLKRVENGATLILSRACNPDDSTVFDSADGSVLLDGQAEMSGWMTADDFDGFDVRPGETCTVQFGVVGDPVGFPRLEMSAAPAYW